MILDYTIFKTIDLLCINKPTFDLETHQGYNDWSFPTLWGYINRFEDLHLDLYLQ